MMWECDDHNDGLWWGNVMNKHYVVGENNEIMVINTLSHSKYAHSNDGGG